MFHTLRWRLPITVSALLGVLLASLLLFSYREMERVLIRAAGFRAQGAADFIAGLLTQSAQRREQTILRALSAPAMHRFLTSPTSATESEIRALLESLGGARRVELWTTDGRRLLEVTSQTTPAIPASEKPPAAAGDSIHTSGNAVFTEAVRAVPGGTPLQPALGYMLVRSILTVTPPGIIGRLVGSDASVRVGDRRGNVWTDFSRRVLAPRVTGRRHGVLEHDPGGGRQLGALAEVRGTPLSVWVGFPFERIVEPAASFARTMAITGAIVLLFGALAIWIISRRITAPLNELARASQDIEARNYAHRVPTTRRDEIGQLARAFNRMAAGLEEADRSLKASDERRELILATARVGLWESDPGTGTVHCSDTMALVHGTGCRGDVTRNAFMDTVHPDDRAAVAKILDGKGGDDVLTLGYRSIWPDKSVHFIEGIGRVRRPKDGQVSVLGASHDVTSHRAMEAQLRQSQKMDAIGQLAGGLAHDFNNLLTAILGYGNLLLESVPPHSPARRDADEILRAGNTAATLTQQLLAFGRRQVLQPTVLNVNDVLSSSHTLLRRLIGEHMNLVTVPGSGLDRVRVDPAQLQQVILNLALNARDAMPDGGKLTIETTNAVLDADYAREHPGVTPGPHVLLTVTDTGIGMDPETRARIFEPFFTTKALGKGTGLGLSTVYGIIKQSGGHIYVYSELGRGSTFKVYLPAVPRSEAAAAAAAATAPRMVGGSETLLVVEDNEQALMLAKTVLERLGYRVLIANSPRTAIAMLEQLVDPVHLMMTDVIMPELHGPDLARILVAKRPGLRVLFTSGYSDDAIVRHGVLSAGTMFLQKPYTPALLAQKVRQALDA